jgi:hypothetical protein
VAPNGVFFLFGTSSLRWKKGRGIYSPSQIVVVAVSGGLSGQSMAVLSGQPDYLARNEISGPIICPGYWVTPSWVLSHFSSRSLGARLSGHGWNIRPNSLAPYLGDAEPGT